MCKFILIQGKENAGKTTTCWKIYQDLVTMLQENNNGHPVVHEFIVPGKVTLQTTSVLNAWELTAIEENTGSFYQEEKQENIDFIAILPTKKVKNCNSNKLGIISAGDEYPTMIAAIHTCLKKSVDTIIMSVHSNKNSDNHFHGERHILPLIEEKEEHNTKNVNFADYKDNDQETKENRVKEEVLKMIFGTRDK